LTSVDQDEDEDEYIVEQENGPRTPSLKRVKEFPKEHLLTSANFVDEVIRSNMPEPPSVTRLSPR
jgi:hypothetical protein